MRRGALVVGRPYATEGSFVTTNWRGTQAIVMQKRKLSTYINALADAGLSLERIVEGDLPVGYAAGDEETYSEKWYSAYKAKRMSTTVVVKARKR